MSLVKGTRNRESALDQRLKLLFVKEFLMRTWLSNLRNRIHHQPAPGRWLELSAVPVSSLNRSSGGT